MTDHLSQLGASDRERRLAAFIEAGATMRAWAHRPLRISAQDYYSAIDRWDALSAPGDRSGGIEDLRADTLAHLEAAIVLLMRTGRPGWADEIARVRNMIEKTDHA